MKRNVVITTTEDGEMYSYIFTNDKFLEIKRCVMSDAWNKQLSLSLYEAKSICQEIVNMELNMIAEKEKQQAAMADVHVRWTNRQDLPAILAIEEYSFSNPWSEDDFISMLHNRKCISMVAVAPCGKIVGFMVYELAKKRLDIINLAVHWGVRSCGVGTALVSHLKGKLSQDGRNELSLVIRETNLAGQLFFRSQGFLAKAVIRDFYDDCHEDAYLMEYRIKETARVASV